MNLVEELFQFAAAGESIDVMCELIHEYPPDMQNLCYKAFGCSYEQLVLGFVPITEAIIHQENPNFSDWILEQIENR